MNVDVKHKLIRRFVVTDASTHDSQMIEHILDERNTNADVYGDSAYRSRLISAILHQLGYRDRIHRKGYRHKPLSQAQKEANRRKSRIRARVEHVFGRQSQFLGHTLMRCIGMIKATMVIGLRNLAYNMDRYVKLAM